MLSENIMKLRKSKGMSQEDLAGELNVVRQTISKWEKGLSVPDAGMLIRIARALETTVDVLLGEEIPEPDEISEIRAISEKLESINEKLAAQGERRRKLWRGTFMFLGVAALLVFIRNILSWAYGFYAETSVQFSTGIIGGADGPTSILVSAKMPDAVGSAIAMAVIAVSIAGISRTKRS